MILRSDDRIWAVLIELLLSGEIETDNRPRYVPRQHVNFAHGERPPVLSIWKIGQFLKQLDYLPIFASFVLINTVPSKASQQSNFLSFKSIRTFTKSRKHYWIRMMINCLHCLLLVYLDGLFLRTVKFACIFLLFLVELPDQQNCQKPVVPCNQRSRSVQKGTTMAFGNFVFSHARNFSLCTSMNVPEPAVFPFSEG